MVLVEEMVSQVAFRISSRILSLPVEIWLEMRTMLISGSQSIHIDIKASRKEHDQAITGSYRVEAIANTIWWIWDGVQTCCIAKGVGIRVHDEGIDKAH